jgi:hypothetical protein
MKGYGLHPVSKTPMGAVLKLRVKHATQRLSPRAATRHYPGSVIECRPSEQT